MKFGEALKAEMLTSLKGGARWSGSRDQVLIVLAWGKAGSNEAINVSLQGIDNSSHRASFRARFRLAVGF